MRQIPHAKREAESARQQEFDRGAGIAADPVVAYMTTQQMRDAIERLRGQMMDAAKNMDFIQAAQYRDELLRMESFVNSREENS